ncbi:ABC transporter ATP-binding protein [Wenzhouxiangella sp. XN79A]|uniref:ABC transporter ATP-binding protein n=1 Tax=Wenzhouxiangella sp. XN79A TaxID=2724193 RepID=UPI00144AF0CD|nr:ABC transporter ATP-binding protein [Wenzhouxiangella sp. XN79A]NKI34927.1 ABC transporter ATP-binding protein [Wenzhouxiangella sp. XN79A]
MTPPLLHVENLTIDFDARHGPVRAVDGISFELAAGETLGLVGESGCGKSVTGLALMGLVPSPPGRVVDGSVRFEGFECVGAPEKTLRSLRGKTMSMIFQEPMTALNPVFTVGRQLIDVLRRHEPLDRRQARRRAVEMLERVGIPRAAARMDEYPHELSGGLRQRIMIAMALACRPRLLIADEPTTALDVTTQAQVLAEIRELTEALGTAVILVTHDLGVIAEVCDRVAVMYCGRIVEQAPVDAVFRQPRHRYTEGLVAAVPRIREVPIERLPTIPGTVPEPGRWPSGCRFAPRCAYADAACRAAPPALRPIGESVAACLHPAGDGR